MPRAARKRSESDIYHIIARGSAKQLIFEDDVDRKHFLNLLQAAMENDMDILAYCLMDNHVHVLVKAPFESLSTSLQKLFSSYASWFNLRHGRCGHLFQGRFKSVEVEEDPYLLSVVRYIHKNPEAAMISDMETYEWSSYKDYTERDGLTKTTFILDIFGGRESFVSFHEEDMPADQSIQDFPPVRKVMSDDDAINLADKLLGKGMLGSLKSFDRVRRDDALIELKAAGLGVRQLQRLTGISLGVISKA